VLAVAPLAVTRINQVELRNSVVSELSQRGWVRVDELTVALDVDLRALVPVLRLLRLQEHIESDGRGRVRRTTVGEERSALSYPIKTKGG